MKIASLYPFPYSIGWHHDTNCTIISDNEIFACEEGKLTENNNDYLSRFPEQGLILGFKKLGISPEEIDLWVLGQPHGVDKQKALSFYFRDILKVPNFENVSKEEIFKTLPHSLAHASLACYGSGWNDCAFLVIDGGGDDADPTNMLCGTFENNQFRVLEKQKKDRGFAYFHHIITELVGFGMFDNGKTMGLGSYGKVNDCLYKCFSSRVNRNPNDYTWHFNCSRSGQSDYRIDRLNPDSYKRWQVLNTPAQHLDLKIETAKYSAVDIAATGQRFLEDEVVQLVEKILARTGKNKIACAGGLFQNVILNMKIQNIPKVQASYVPPACNDAGISLGAALYFKNLNLHSSEISGRKPLNPSLGPAFSDREILEIIDSYSLNYEIEKNIPKRTANEISNGTIVGWFQGSAELGPRSLGNRSVLADPRDVKNKAKINQLLKKRDWFMPYAPSVLEEHMEDYFLKPKTSPYMATAFVVREDKKAEIPAAIHVDGTCRPNSVNREMNKIYYETIEEFRKITGVPMILNTSFNRHGIPTISKPRQAINHLLNGNVDVLIIGKYVVERKFRKEVIQEDKIIDEKIYLEVIKYKPIIISYLASDFTAFNESLSLLHEEDKGFVCHDDHGLKIKNFVFSRQDKNSLDNKLETFIRFLNSNT